MAETHPDPLADQASLELLVLHVPKTGGTSLRGALRSRYGEALALHYQRRWDDLDGKQALVGHFFAAQAEHIRAERRVTVLRDPLDRVISEYFHHKTADSPANRYGERVRAGQTFSDFLAQPAYCKAYTRYYFADADMDRWEVIDHARLRRDWSGVMQSLGLPAKPRETNVRAEVYADYVNDRAAILADADLMRKAREVLREDQDFYERWAR